MSGNLRRLLAAAGRLAGRRAGLVVAIGVALGIALLMAGADLGGLGGGAAPASAQSEKPLPPGAEACIDCHEAGRPGRRVAGEPPRFDPAAILASPHSGLDCTDCHQDLAGAEMPHAEELSPVACAMCHDQIQTQFEESLHGVAANRGDPLAPTCATCHGKHDIRRASDPDAMTAVINVPLLCGRCHHEGSPVSLTHSIPQDSILENYSESIHGEGLFKQGLVVTAVCTSCHTAHHVLPHTDPRSSISRGKIADTCTQCHGQIEEVHRKVIRGELWEKQPHMIPACVDCHSPHKVRKVFYTQGLADRDCMRCHARSDLASATGLEAADLHVNTHELAGSRHAKVACVQCHTDCTPSRERACETVIERVDCSICHNEVVEEYKGSTAWAAGQRGQPRCSGLPRLPRHPRHARQDRFQVADLLPQHSRSLRSLSPGGGEGGRAVPGARDRGGRTLYRVDPRQGAPGERAHGHRNLCQLPHRTRRAAGERSDLDCEPSEHRRDLRAVSPGNLRALHRKHPLGRL